jgi:hypothetical protein
MIPSRAEPLSALRRTAVAPVSAAVIATLILIVVALVVPARASAALHWYLVITGAIAAAAAIRVITVRYPVLWRSSLDLSPIPARTPEFPARLRAIDRLVSRSEWDAVGYQQELRPILRAIAAQRLATYWTIDIDADPAAARAVLGEQVWALLARVDLERARDSRGIAREELRVAVARLEELDVVAHP